MVVLAYILSGLSLLMTAFILVKLKVQLLFIERDPVREERKI